MSGVGPITPDMADGSSDSSSYCRRKYSGLGWVPSVSSLDSLPCPACGIPLVGELVTGAADCVPRTALAACVVGEGGCPETDLPSVGEDSPRSGTPAPPLIPRYGPVPILEPGVTLGDAAADGVVCTLFPVP